MNVGIICYNNLFICIVININLKMFIILIAENMFLAESPVCSDVLH